MRGNVPEEMPLSSIYDLAQVLGSVELAYGGHA